MTKGPANQTGPYRDSSRHSSCNPEIMCHKGYKHDGPRDIYKGTNNPNNYYSITMNPVDELQCFFSASRVKDFKSAMLKQLHGLHKFNDIIFHIEVSGKGRLHLHGIFNFTTPAQVIDFYVNDIVKYQNKFSYEIDTIDDIDKWTKYMGKQSLDKITKKDLIAAHSVYVLESENIARVKVGLPSAFVHLPFDWEDEKPIEVEQ